MSMPSSWKTKCVGVSWVPGYPENIYALDALASDGAPLLIELVRNPLNEHDENAIEIHVPALGDLAFIGHLPKAIAARFAPDLDAGEQWTAHINKVNVHPDHPENPGIDIAVERVTSDEPF